MSQENSRTPAAAFSGSIDPLLEILRCPVCRSERSIRAVEGAMTLPSSFESHALHLECDSCRTGFPVTDDCIPILLPPENRHFLDGSEAGSSAIAANFSIYESISDQYDQFTRQNQKIGVRLRGAVRRIFDGTGASRERRHLDFGCGPGHVLCWLKELGFQQVGLDVSIRNLRTARAKTGCLAVCGDACNMPFNDQSFDVITESSVLHHIDDWRAAVRETARICRPGGGVVLDAEPSQAQMAWGPLAIAAFNLRFPVYKMLSYIWNEKYVFRNTEQAKLNLLAEIHHQPGSGFPVEEFGDLFGSGFVAEIIHSPTPDLEPKGRPGWKTMVICILSFRNPWNPKYGAFAAVAKRSEAGQ